MRSSRFEAEAKKRSRIRFPRIVFREKNSQGVFGSTNIFFLFPLSFSPPFDRGRNSGISTNCKSCASKRTKRHEESRQRTYFTFIRSLGRLNHSWPRVELSIPVAAPRLRKPTWPLVFLPIFPFETWSHPVSSFSFVRGWILIIVRPIPFPLPIIRIPRMLFEPRSVEPRTPGANGYFSCNARIPEFDRWESSFHDNPRYFNSSLFLATRLKFLGTKKSHLHSSRDVHCIFRKKYPHPPSSPPSLSPRILLILLVFVTQVV